MLVQEGAVLVNEVGSKGISQTKELIAIKTRQYAKRQATWARGQMNNWQKIDPSQLKSLLKKI